MYCILPDYAIWKGQEMIGDDYTMDRNDLALKLSEAFSGFSFHPEQGSGHREGTFDFTVYKPDLRLGLLKITEELVEDEVDIPALISSQKVLSHLNPKAPLILTSRGIK